MDSRGRESSWEEDLRFEGEKMKDNKNKNK
jgi:hypothetical protein